MIQWNVKNRVDLAALGLFFDVSEDISDQRRRVSEYIKMLGEKHGGVKYSIAYLLCFF